MAPETGTVEGDVMTIKLPPDLERYVSDKVARGEYPSADEAIRDGLALLRHHDEEQQDIEELRREIALGIADDDNERVGPFDPLQTLKRVEARRLGGASEAV